MRCSRRRVRRCLGRTTPIIQQRPHLCPVRFFTIRLLMLGADLSGDCPHVILSDPRERPPHRRACGAGENLELGSETAQILRRFAPQNDDPSPVGNHQRLFTGQTYPIPAIITLGKGPRAKMILIVRPHTLNSAQGTATSNAPESCTRAGVSQCTSN